MVAIENRSTSQADDGRCRIIIPLPRKGLLSRSPDSVQGISFSLEQNDTLQTLSRPGFSTRH